MDIYFERLKKRAQGLGNHYRKYTSIIDINLDGLMNRLENAGVIERVHLWAAAHDYMEEMAIISEIGTSLKEKLDDLGCYFAIQFLQMNINALDALILELTRSEDKLTIYKKFMLRTGHDFRTLTASYMKQLLKLYSPPKLNLEFVFLGVGTRSDQDDIDIGVVDRGEENRDILNKCIGKMNSEMLKKAISLHFHISEHVGNITSYSASIKEYAELLDNEIHDFVIITEMLGAARILGDRKLFFDFRRDITSRYYFYNTQHEYLKFHEGYLRGIIGETRSFMFRELPYDIINPKGDGLRMIKGTLFAAKTIFCMRQVNAWAILDELKIKDKSRSASYNIIEGPLTFLEIFRYLYQLLIAQEEEIQLGEKNAKENLSLVAEAMGYRSVGFASATDFLITDYYQNILQAKKTLKNLLPYSVTHLESITVFGKVLRHKKVTEKGEKRIGNLALRFIKETRFFRGTRFWDDIISVLQRKDGKILKRLANDISSLPQQQQDEILEKFIDWGWNSFISLYSLITLIYKYKDVLPDPELYLKLNNIYFDRLKADEEIVRRISVVFTHYPELINDFIVLLTDKQQLKLYNLLDYYVWDQNVKIARDRLQFLLRLNYGTSNYFKLRMQYVLKQQPQYIKYLNNFQRLNLIGKGSLAEAERTKNVKQKLHNLKFYYDYEFFRIAIDSLQGNSAIGVSFQYTEFSDNYLRLVFDSCKKEIDETVNNKIITKDLLGVFVTGGQGQMQAFDDDFDLIILLNSSSHNIKEYCSAIIKKMHKEILKCGIMPHYRLADFTGSYICTFHQLIKLLKDNSFERFIDKAQLLGARMVVGSGILQEAVEKEILIPYVLDKKEEFIFDMVNEIESRHTHFTRKNPEIINVKETTGGLRDIEMILSILRTFYKIRETSNFKLLIIIQSLLPEFSKDFQKLFHAYEFLRKIRILYRLTIAAEDNININYINNLLQNLNENSKKALTPESLFTRLNTTLRAVNRTCTKILYKAILPSMVGQNNLK